MELISTDNLAIGYEGRTVADHISFEIDEGDFLCIVGENGAGKSTLMKTILGLQPPASGEIIMGAGVRRTDIGYLPQQTPVQKDFPASVAEVVLSGCQGSCGWRPFYSRAARAAALTNMQRMGITDLAGRCYRELSGGQQQRVLLARALCAADRLLLLDEPVSGLDPKATQDMYDLICRLNREGVTMIMISHDIGAAIEYATHILHIGSTVFFGTKEEYMKSSESRMFLDREGGDA